MKIWVNTIVNNEEKFIWFALMSVINYVDRILVWDSGSTDKTVKIIRSIKSKKIQFREVGKLDSKEFTKMRQKMLEASICEWILILDGDEIWWTESISRLVSQINKKKDAIAGVVVPMIVPVGDIFHLQDTKAGKYKILGKTGHLSLKAIRKIPGLHVDWPYGKEGFFDSSGKLIQEREDIMYIDAPFLHVTHLKRSNKARPFDKFKHELGRKVDKDFFFPEVLHRDSPRIVSSPWKRIKGVDLLKAKLLTPLRDLKRKFT